MNQEPHKTPIDPPPAHQCYLCQAPMPDNHCGHCKAEHHYANGELVTLRVYLRINKSVCFLYIRPTQQTAEILMNCKYLPVSWDIAKSLTPDNIHKRLKTILVFS